MRRPAVDAPRRRLFGRRRPASAMPIRLSAIPPWRRRGGRRRPDRPAPLRTAPGTAAPVTAASGDVDFRLGDRCGHARRSARWASHCRRSSARAFCWASSSASRAASCSAWTTACVALSISLELRHCSPLFVEGFALRLEIGLFGLPLAAAAGRDAWRCVSRSACSACHCCRCWSRA